MVIADSESPGPLKKRPRLSLKSMKHGSSKDGTVKNNGTDDKFKEEPVDEEKNNCDEAKTVQELAMAGEESLMSNEEESVVPAVASLENLGNTCFLNSILQVLRYTPRFLEGLEDLHQEIITVEKLKKQEAAGKEDNSSDETSDSYQTLDIVKFLYKLYKEMERREEKHPDVASSDVMSMALKPEKLLNSLRELNPMFEGNLQHDAQELMRCILCYLQDAEKEIYKMKSSLPPRVLPQKGPTNPIMQKFLLGSKATNSQVISPGKEIEKTNKTSNKSADLTNSFHKPDILDEINMSEAANTGGCRENADPKETDTAFVVDDKELEDCNSIKEKSESETCTPTVTQDSSHEENPTKNGKLSRKGNSSRSRSRSTSSRRSGSAKKKEEGSEEINNDLKSNAKGGRNKRGRNRDSGDSNNDAEKRAKTENSEISDPSQQNILHMLKGQISRKRLGMRGAVVKDNSDKNGSAAESNAGNSKSEQKIPAVTKNSNANRLAAFGIMGEKIEHKKPKSEAESQDSSNVDYSKLNGGLTKKQSSCDGEGQTKLPVSFIKLEKCDHVCNSPKKSVSADFAERTLSPMKSSSSSKIPEKSESVRKLNFNCNNSNFSPTDDPNLSGEKEALGSSSSSFSSCKSPLKNRQLSPSKLTKCSPKKNKKDFVEKLFMGSMMLRTRCLECENSKERSEEFHDISVPLRKDKDEDDDDKDSDSDDESNFGLKKLMDAFTEVERLRDENKYFCENCFRLVEAERSLHYEVLPDILTLHLKRFQASSGYFGYMSKINDHINIPIVLPCLRYKCPSPCSRPDHRYRLYAIVTHAGVTLTAGHYLAYVRVIEAAKLRNGSLSKISPASAKFNSNQTAKFIAEKPSTFFDKAPAICDPKCARRPGTNTKFLSVPMQKYESDWLECDDETIRVYDEEKFCTLLTGEGGALLGTPYVLFYHKVNI